MVAVDMGTCVGGRSIRDIFCPRVVNMAGTHEASIEVHHMSPAKDICESL